MSIAFTIREKWRMCVAAVAVCIIAALCAWAPSPAWGLYSDVATDYPASQDLEPAGEVLYPADIPEGTYSVPAMTTSYMCKLFDPSSMPDDSNVVARQALENKCLITVRGDTIAATFYISKAYTALYYGTAQQAASLTDSEGLDGSAYMFGSPADGYVYHLFTIAVPYLNASFPLATYTGGQSFEAGKWYDRNCMVMSSDEIMRAIEQASATDPEDPGSDPEDPGNGTEDPGSDPEDPGNGTDDPGNETDPNKEADDPGSGADPSKKDNPADNGDRSNTARASEGSRSNTAAGAVAGRGSGSDDGPGGGSSGSDDNAGGGSAGGGSSTTTSRVPLRGTLLSVVSPEQNVVEVAPLNQVAPDTGFKFGLPHALACGLLALLVGGVVWRAVAFRRERRWNKQ